MADELAGLLAGFDPETMRKLMAAMGPSADERRSANTMGLLSAGLGMLAAPRNNQWGGIANAVGRGFETQQGALSQAQQQRMQAMQGYSTMMDLAQKQQALKDQQAAHQAAQANMIPAQPGSPQMGPPTEQGGMQPATPGTPASMNWPGYQAQLATIGPQYAQQAVQLDPFVRRQLMRQAENAAQSGAPTSAAPQPYAPSTAAAFGLPPGASPPQGATKGGMTQQIIAQRMRLISELRKVGLHDEAMSVEDKMSAMLPKSKAENLVVRDAAGNPTYASTDDQGNVTQLGITPAEKLQFLNAGNKFIPSNAYTGRQEGAPIAIGQDANSQASNAVAWARLKQDQQQFDTNQSKPQVVTGANGEVYSVDPRGATGRAVTGADGQPLNKGDKPTEFEAKAGMFVSQMTNASKTLDKLESKGAGQNTWSQLGIQSAGSDGAKMFGMSVPGTKMASRAIASTQSQLYDQAQRQWAESYLRIKTGAAAQANEIDNNIRTFFPQPGDDKVTVEAKRSARRQAEADVAQSASGRRATGHAAALPDPLGLR